MNDPVAIEADARAGVIASVVAAVMGGKRRNGEPLTVEDFFPRVASSKPKQGWRAAKARLAGYFGGVNAYAETRAVPAKRKGA